MLRLVASILGLGVLGYLGLCALLYFMQARLLYQPTRQLAGTPADVGLPHEEVFITSGDATLHAWYVPAPMARGWVLFCHGNAGNISHRLETLRILHGLGVNTLIFDYRGYGRSTGRPSEEGTATDALACWQWLRNEQGAHPERTVIMGRSLGGAVAARLAWDLSQASGRAQGPGGLVLESTFTSVPDMGARIYPYLPVRLLSRFRYDTLGLLPGLGCPVLVAHSPDDDVVPYALGKRVLEAAPTPKEFLELSGDHNGGYLLTGEPYVRGLDRFFGMVMDEANGPGQTAPKAMGEMNKDREAGRPKGWEGDQ